MGLNKSNGNMYEFVTHTMKELAVPRGYPVDYFDGQSYPRSVGKINTAEAAILIETIHQFAAEYDIPLIEAEEE
jgi:hypothetical protein